MFYNKCSSTKGRVIAEWYFVFVVSLFSSVIWMLLLCRENILCFSAKVSVMNLWMLNSRDKCKLDLCLHVWFYEALLYDWGRLGMIKSYLSHRFLGETELSWLLSYSLWVIMHWHVYPTICSIHKTLRFVNLDWCIEGQLELLIDMLPICISDAFCHNLSSTAPHIC